MDKSSAHQLLEQMHWLRNLAQQLVRDPQLAEDAVQDTVVAALRLKQRRPTSLRAWLGTALRNAVRQRYRADSRRQRREARIAESHEEAAPSALEVVSELSTYRRLLELVDALEEPYRTAITRHFVRGESPDEIARELRIPSKTVYSRIHRGLSRLRGQMDESVSGGRRTWRAAFLLARVPRESVTPATITGTGIAVMKIKLLAVAIAIASLIAVWQLSGMGFDDRVPLHDGRDRAPSIAGMTGEESPAAIRRDVASPQPTVTSDLDEEPTSVVGLVRGSVLDLAGHPVPNLELVFERLRGTNLVVDPSIEGVRGDHLGRFELPLPAYHGRLRVADPAWATALHPWLDGAVPVDPTIVIVAPKRDYAGRVLDEHGLPVVDARIDLDLPDAWGRDLRAAGHVVALPKTLALTHSDGGGAFRFASVPFIEGAVLRAVRDDYEPDDVPVPATSSDNLLLTLRLLESDGVRGVVLDTLDRPVPGALVGAGERVVESDANGRFILGRPRLEDGVVWALKPGLGATSLSLAANPALLDSDVEIILRLPAEPLAIRGVLVDARGAPVSGATVWTPDTTYLGEVLVLGHGVPTRGMNTVEGVLTGTSTPSRTVKTTTDTDGRFEIIGLTSRRYALFALDENLAAAGPVYASPGTVDVRLELPAEGRRSLAGRVLSHSGVPLAGVRIGLGRGCVPVSACAVVMTRLPHRPAGT